MTIPSPEEHQIPQAEEESTQGRAVRESSLFEGRQYEDDTRRQWDNRIFNIKLDYLSTFSRLGRWAVRLVGIAMILVLLYLIYLAVIHYTASRFSWLSPEELTRVENIYGRVAGVSAPIMLMSNAWIIWWMSRTRRGG